MSRNLRLLFGNSGLSLTLGLSGGLVYGDEEKSPEASTEKRKYYVEDIKATMKKHIDESNCSNEHNKTVQLESWRQTKLETQN